RKMPRYIKILRKIEKHICFFSSLPILWLFMLKAFSGKSVAIVGSGPTTLGKGLGTFIDSHDLVVRINLLDQSNREDDLGLKSHFRFIGCTLNDLHRDYFLAINKDAQFISTRKNIAALNAFGQKSYFYNELVPKYATY